MMNGRRALVVRDFARDNSLTSSCSFGFDLSFAVSSVACSDNP